MDSPLYIVFSNLLIDLPAHVAKLVGIALCFVYWRRYPRACLLALIAFLLFFLQTAIAIGFTIWVQTVGRRSITTGEIGNYFRVSGSIQSMVKAAGFGFFLAAIFWRDHPPKTT